MTIGELLDLEAKRTPGKWRWDRDASCVDTEHEGHVRGVIEARAVEPPCMIDAADEDMHLACAAVNALGPLLAMLVAIERAADSEDEHNAMDSVRDAARAARRAIER